MSKIAAMVGRICHPAFCTIRICNPKIKKSALQPDMLLDYMPVPADMLVQ